MLCLFFLVGVFTIPTETVANSYVAGVFEHRVILNPDPRVPVTRQEALQHMTKNLDVYEEQAARAAQQVRLYHSATNNSLQKIIWVNLSLLIMILFFIY